MILVSFTSYDGKGPITFIVDKIVAFTKDKRDPNKTDIFILSAREDDSEDIFVVDTPYEVVKKKLENI